MTKIEYVPFGRLADVKEPENCLIKAPTNVFSDYKVIRFSSRLALEAFNKKAGLRPLVYTKVPKGMAIWAHQKETI